MGIPQHYSRDIAQRCQSLIRHLLPLVQKGLPHDRSFDGPLETTFLLAMATPAVVLPIERIFKPARPEADAVGDDRAIDPALAEQLDDVFGPARTFADAPFFARECWSYIPNVEPFPVAGYWPYEILERLGTDAALAEAERTPTRRIMLDLRNALAHGGIAYLDASGRSTDGQAEMFAFASAVTDRRRLIGINLLRVRQRDFCAFVMAWADWLAASPVRHALNTQDPLAA
ncbi:MAG: hypothetical protein IT533_15720 [Hyphomicrobiales bacterium]|nr:hypothetical protein [Hyphomicrobiales bacterium]